MPKNCRIRVLNLPDDVEEHELNRIFGKSGPIENIEIGMTKKAKRTFALIDFQNKSDAKDAVYSNNEVYLWGKRLEVEIFKPSKPAKNVPEFGEPPPKMARIRSPDIPNGIVKTHRILVRELPKCATWQDLEDRFGAVGKITHIKMFENSKSDFQSAHVGFERVEDAKQAMREFHSTEFTSSQGATTVIHIRGVGKLKPFTPTKYRRQSSSRSRSSSRSPIRYRRRARSSSRSSDRSPTRSPSSRSSSEPDVYLPKYETSGNPEFRVTIDGIPSTSTHALPESSTGIHVELFKPEESADCRGSKIQPEARSRRRSTSSESSEAFNDAPRILVRGLSKCATWQALKDHFRAVGNVEHVKVFEDTQSAVVKFERDEDVQRAIRKFHLTKFTSFRGVTTELHIREYGSPKPSTLISRRRRSSSSRSSSRSPIRRRARSSSRSSDRSPMRRRGRSSTRSSDRSPPRRRARSRSPSPHRSPPGRRSTTRSQSSDRSPMRYLDSPRRSPTLTNIDSYIPLNQKLENREFRVTVVGVPVTGTTEDLQNHFRNFGATIESFESDTAIVRFQKYKMMKKAIRKLDGAKFLSAVGEIAALHLQEDKPIGPNGRRCRSRSYSHSRSPTPTYVWSKD